MKIVLQKMSRQTFASVFALFVALNLYSYLTMDARCNLADCHVLSGFPYAYYGYGGWPTTGIVWIGVLIDVVFAAVVSAILGYIARP